MGPGNRHDDEPLDEHNEGSGDEPGDDADEGHPATRRQLPDPLDRVWLHPTELSSLGAAFAPEPPVSARPAPRHRTLAWLAPLLAGAAGALLTVTVLAVTGSFDRSTQTVGTTLLAGDATTTRAPTAAVALARLAPSIVAVYARDAQGARRGSGVCVRHGAQVLTSMRVVGSASTVDVVTSDGRHHAAQVVGRDRVTSLVLLDLQDDATVPAAPLADATPSTGAPVWLIGASATKAPWMSSGMTSSNDALVASKPGPTTSGLLETDAASNASGIGGAFVDASGSVAGIVVGHLNGSPTTYVVSIGVAVGIARELDANGVAQHGTLGITGVDTPHGPMVEAMAADAPAARAGVRKRDLVTAVDGRAVESMADVTALVQSQDPGRTVVVDLRRGTKAVTARVKLGATTG